MVLPAYNGRNYLRRIVVVVVVVVFSILFFFFYHYVLPAIGLCFITLRIITDSALAGRPGKSP